MTNPNKFDTVPDRLVIRLSADWAILTDGLQWIVAKATGSGTRRRWKPLAYIASTKAALERVLREEGACIDTDGARAFSGLPETYREWRRDLSAAA